jgi:hypothetical protein
MKLSNFWGRDLRQVAAGVDQDYNPHGEARRDGFMGLQPAISKSLTQIREKLHPCAGAPLWHL